MYVVDTGRKRVEKFDPEGRFILMFGGKVNENGEDVCRRGEKCERFASAGTGDGEFENWSSYSSFITVGPGGDVYVGDEARVEVFEASGAWKENVSLAGLSATAAPIAVAVDASGNVYVKDAGIAGVRELEPNGTEKPAQFDAGSNTVTAIAADSASGHVFIGDSAGGFHVMEYDAAGNEIAAFGQGTVSGENRGLAFSSVTASVYASDGYVYGGSESAMVWAIPVPVNGAPLIDSVAGTSELHGAATLSASVDPEGSETTVRFEYVDAGHFAESGYADATSTTPVPIGSGFEPQAVSASLTSLVPGVVYHYRAVAASQAGTTTGEDRSLQEIPAALIVGPWVTNVAATSVTFEAKIDPQGSSTTYRFEYGTGTSYGHVVTGSVGEGTEEVLVSHHVQGLEEGATYHFRVLTSNSVGAWQSADRTFTTQMVANEQTLPDGREWELVTPPNKHGALIEPELIGKYGALQAASDGHGIAYLVNEPISEHPPSSYGAAGTQAVSMRSYNGWATQEVGYAEKVTEEPYTIWENGEPPRVLQFSNDLSQVVVEPSVFDLRPLSSQASERTPYERTLYLHDNSTGEYLPMVTPANVPAGAKIGPNLVEGGQPVQSQEIVYLSATPDLHHIVFQTPRRLTPEAIEGPGDCTKARSLDCPPNLYEWSEGRLKLIDILPDGKPLEGENGNGASLGRNSKDTMHSISNDGRRIVWQQGYRSNSRQVIKLYVRDMTEGKTRPIGGLRARFETMSEDGSTVFYWEGHELYAYDVDTETTTDVSGGYAAGEHRGGVKDLLVLASEDGAYVYYEAEGVLAAGAVKGEDNLYVSHFDGSGWSTRLIGTLSGADEFSNALEGFIVEQQQLAARVSPNGRYLAFMSSRPLTGYDNLDAVSQQPDEEVYLYDAVSDRLVCASCNPTGARPHGVYDNGSTLGSPMVERGAIWPGRWLAANVPGIREGEGYKYLNTQVLTQPRFLSNSGRLFFNSADSLVARDTNGLMDVYEYEPAGVGSCANLSTGFSSRDEGCVSLISAGTASSESAFMDASENGDDVFFVTSEKLVGEDYDTTNDIYDAHACSALVPCRAPLVGAPACTSGDSCKNAPLPQPTLFGAAPSATFSGTGNIPLAAPRLVRPRRLSAAQKLARALRMCHRKKGNRKRAACEKRVRRRYRVKMADRATSSGKGGR